MHHMYLNLIFDFNFHIKYYSPMFSCEPKKYKINHFNSISKEANFRVLQWPFETERSNWSDSDLSLVTDDQARPVVVVLLWNLSGHDRTRLLQRPVVYCVASGLHWVVAAMLNSVSIGASGAKDCAASGRCCRVADRRVQSTDGECPVTSAGPVSSRSCVRLGSYLRAWALLDFLGLLLCF
jgi:hypothetical protein